MKVELRVCGGVRRTEREEPPGHGRGQLLVGRASELTDVEANSICFTLGSQYTNKIKKCKKEIIKISYQKIDRV